MKIGLFALGILALATASGTSFGRSISESAGDASKPFDDAPLLQWDLLEELAQQTPEVTSPPAKAQEQLPAQSPAAAPAEPATPTIEPPPAESDVPNTVEPEDPQLPAEGTQGEDEFSLGDIPIVETIELTTDKAKKALDTYVAVREKYKDAELENYENLQDFVDQSPLGKAFEADVKSAGFADVTEWNTTITTLSFAYDNSIQDQTADIQQQITELEADVEMAQDMRDRMVTALKAMIPSDNNKKVIEELKADASYAEKLKSLEAEAE